MITAPPIGQKQVLTGGSLQAAETTSYSFPEAGMVEYILDSLDFGKTLQTPYVDFCKVKKYGPIFSPLRAT